MLFSELPLNNDLRQAISNAGFQECMPVQEKTFVHTLAGQDVLVQSQTGSGKTVSFLVTIFQQLLDNEKFKGRKALIIVPTRELAVQIETEANRIGKDLPFKVGCFFGGMGYGGQEKMLRDGVDLVIGTPGRLLDFGRSRKIQFKDFGILVIDEADRLFDMGFFPDLKMMLKQMPPFKERLTMLVSATLNMRVRQLVWEYMNVPEEVIIQPGKVTVDSVEQELYHVGRKDKVSLLLGVIRKHSPKNVLIFTNTKRAAEEVDRRLQINGIQAGHLIGDLPQKKRLQIIDEFRAGKLRYLVATDVAARGLDIEDLEMVVNYDLPDDSENYVHRIGRTARAGKKGRAIALVCESYVYNLSAIEKFTKKTIPVQLADESMYAEDKSRDMNPRQFRRGGYGRDDHRLGPHRGGRRRGGQERGASKERFQGNAAARSKEHTPAEHPHEHRRPRHAKHPGTGVPVTGPAGGPAKRTHRDRRPRRDTVPNGSDTVKANRSGTLEERVAYYRSKYGDNFKVTPEMIKADEDRTAKAKQEKAVSENKKSVFGFFQGLFAKKEKQ